jgi:hypothetical protein
MAVPLQLSADKHDGSAPDSDLMLSSMVLQ